MESILQHHMGYERVEATGNRGGGSINKGEAYETEKGTIFVKHNSQKGSLQMFDGEFAGLTAIHATGTIRCPKPIKVIDLGDSGACLITSFIDISGRGRGEVVKEFGRQLARMHKHNGKKTEDEGESRFGFHTTTCCGAIPLVNDFVESWPQFFVQNRITPQIERILVESGDRDLNAAFPELIRAVDSIFKGYQVVPPSLVHGDLWAGNWGSTSDEKPVIFDPATFYADPEFEQGIMNMFGGFGKEFWSSYHEIIPKIAGRERRVRFYELFHHLNHWNHFGASYKSGTMQIIRELTSVQTQF
ncbi:unnamed protein product, partial [Mesorhabditis belari]|uniref:protein-ribulosamine 3-kinase n=1 Tax=Mesorhabditis belari TaxID=2138241 RepID=A0AAF3EQ02_9BILA